MSTTVTRQKCKRYSEAFKLTVIRDIEENYLSMNKAAKKYDLCDPTIKRWLEKYGKHHLLPIKILVMEPSEQDPIAAKEARIKELESLVVTMQLKEHRQAIFYEEALRQLGASREVFEKKTGLPR